ncbi:unnamed protein product [Prunus armeniaca]
MDLQDQCNHICYTSEGMLPNFRRWSRADEHRSGNGKKMFSPRAKRKQTSPVHSLSRADQEGKKLIEEIVEFIPERVRSETSPEQGRRLEEDVELIDLDLDKPKRKTHISSHLSKEEKVELTTFLRKNNDAFLWSPFDMPGIDPQIIFHRLHVNTASKPITQKRRNFASERIVIIEAEIDKLLVAGFIEKVSYS